MGLHSTVPLLPFTVYLHTQFFFVIERQVRNFQVITYALILVCSRVKLVKTRRSLVLPIGFEMVLRNQIQTSKSKWFQPHFASESKEKIAIQLLSWKTLQVSDNCEYQTFSIVNRPSSHFIPLLRLSCSWSTDSWYLTCKASVAISWLREDSWAISNCR